jgi:Carboxypeptidase regulatory-like domain
MPSRPLRSPLLRGYCEALAVLAACLVLSLSASAQVQPPVTAAPGSHGSHGSPTSRSIEGLVLTKEGAPVPGAVVLIKDSKTLQVRSYIAQQDGKYHFFGLSTDVNYQLRAQANGLTSKTKTVSVFDSHAKVKLNLKLTKKIKS